MLRTLLALLIVPTLLVADDRLLSEASALESAGKFREASTLLRNALVTAAAAEKEAIAFELDRLRRIRLDFPLTEGALWEELSGSIAGITREEFRNWIDLGWFDGRVIDDTLYFFERSRSNLFWRHAELAARRIPQKKEDEVEHLTWRTADSITVAAREAGRPYVLPKRFRATMTVSVKADAVPSGETIRAWLPIPRAYPFQIDFAIIESSSPVRAVAPEESMIRSAYMEQTAQPGERTVFRIVYEYRAYGVSFDLHPEATKPISPDAPFLARFLKEEPHVVFTGAMRELSGRIVGGENNPLRAAKKIFDWISENVLYSYAIEYSTIRNISEYCRARMYGDCGQHALLFITLCRLNGIPARWQSGWYTLPGAKTIHDWTEIYLHPYGWIPVDPDMGVFAFRYFMTLSLEQRRALRDFYFGGLEQWRMAANAGHCEILAPEKRTYRSDVVDFQRGEVEWKGGNVYFDQFSNSLRVEVIGE